jgi:hypothetical protein
MQNIEETYISIYHIAITELSQVFNNLINSVLSFIFLLFHQIHYKLRAYRITL